HLPSHDLERLCADSRVAHRQVAEMHLDERLEKSREVIGKQLAVGQKKVSSAFNNLWAEMEAMREAQRKRQEEQKVLKASEPSSPMGEKHGGALGGICELMNLLCSARETNVN